MYYIGLKHLHIFTVVLFLILYFIKTILLIGGKKTNLEKISKKLRVPEMIISSLFLLTGVLLLIEKPIITKFLILKWITLLAAIPMAIMAFKKSNKILAVLSYFLLIMTYGFAEMNAKRPVSKQIETNVVTDPNATDYNVLQHGKAVYEANCVMCHGEDGKKGLAGAKDLSVSTLSDNEKITVIMNGKGAMSPYKKVLTEDDIKAVVQYINTLKE